MEECPWGRGGGGGGGGEACVQGLGMCIMGSHSVQIRVVDHDLEVHNYYVQGEMFFGCVVSCKIFVVFACCER